MMMATIRDVAKEADVSDGTVSNVFNDRPFVTQATRERVLAAAERVGYRRNTVARALRLGRGNALGLCLRDIGNPTFGSIVLGAEAVARASNYQVILGNSAGSRDVEEGYLRVFLGQRVAGVITAPVLEASPSYEALEAAGTPLAFINQRPRGIRGDLVKHDYADGTRLATEYLLHRGHTRIGIVYGPAYEVPGHEQRRSFGRVMSKAGLSTPPAWEVFAPLGLDGPFRAAREVLTSATPPTALIGSTLAITLGCMRAMSETGAEVDFVGTGDEAWLGIFPTMTIVRQRPEEVGRAAVTQVLARLAQRNEQEDAVDIVLPVDLVTRTPTREWPV